jgi:chromosome segregation ATPase
MINSAGGVELGPLEIQINSIQKSIEKEHEEIVELQLMWLRNQHELVKLSQETDSHDKNVENLKKQFTILSQKKLRIETNIERASAETSGIEKSIKHMQNDMMKLNMHLHRERGMEENLHQDNILTEHDFICTLKEA